MRRNKGNALGSQKESHQQTPTTTWTTIFKKQGAMKISLLKQATGKVQG
jgi:hypothetical protein